MQFNDVAIAPDGDIVAVGSIGAQNSDFLVMRLSGGDGTPADDFGNAGIVVSSFDIPNSSKHDVASAVGTTSDGDIVVAGYVQTALAGSLRPGVVKLTSNGSADIGFSPSGKQLYDPCANHAFGCLLWISDIAVLADERFVLTGHVSAAVGYYNYDFLAMRFLADGQPDPSFGQPGALSMVAVPFNLGPTEESSADQASSVFLEGERILLAGRATVATGDFENPYRYDYALARLDHGLEELFVATPSPGPGGTLGPAVPQQVGHSDRAEFMVLPGPGYAVAEIGSGPGECGGGLDGVFLVTAPVTASCVARVSFKPIGGPLFLDGFE